MTNWPTASAAPASGPTQLHLAEFGAARLESEMAPKLKAPPPTSRGAMDIGGNGNVLKSLGHIHRDYDEQQQLRPWTARADPNSYGAAALNTGCLMNYRVFALIGRVRSLLNGLSPVIRTQQASRWHQIALSSKAIDATIAPIWSG